jgi:hypothetical protein
LLLNLLKNLSNNKFDKILIGSTIVENTKQFTMDDPLDAAGACPATYTKNTTTRNGELPFMMMPLYLIPYSRNKPGSAGLRSLTKENFKKAFDNFDYKK